MHCIELSDFGQSLPITWLTRFALANAEPSLSLPEKPGLKLDVKEVKNLPDWEDRRAVWIRREGWEYP